MDDADFNIEFAEANENDDVVINDEQNVKNLVNKRCFFDGLDWDWELGFWQIGIGNWVKRLGLGIGFFDGLGISRGQPFNSFSTPTESMVS
jgi:hypothetical protein